MQEGVSFLLAEQGDATLSGIKKSGQLYREPRKAENSSGPP